MLVLTRKKDMPIVIRDRDTGRELARVVIVGIYGDRVKVGFEAPESTEVNRIEIDAEKHPYEYA